MFQVTWMSEDGHFCRMTFNEERLANEFRDYLEEKNNDVKYLGLSVVK